jgi:hypothetical protein
VGHFVHLLFHVCSRKFEREKRDEARWRCERDIVEEIQKGGGLANNCDVSDNDGNDTEDGDFSESGETSTTCTIAHYRYCPFFSMAMP